MTNEGITVGHTDLGYVSLIINDGETAASVGITPKRAVELAGTLQSEAAEAHRLEPREPIPAFQGEREE